MCPEELAGGFGLPGAVTLAAPVEESFLKRLAPLPEATRRLLLVAAAEPTLDPVLIWQAAGMLGVRAGDVAPAAEAGLIEFGGPVRFRDPLARFAVYRTASPQERQSVHHALAATTDPDRRAWHRGQAAPGPDEDLAAELERAVPAARARGGLGADGAFRERAAELTPDPGRRSRRGAGRGPGEVPGRRRRRSAAAARPRPGRAARRARPRPGGVAARPADGRGGPRPGRASVAGQGGAAARAAASRAGQAGVQGRVPRGADLQRTRRGGRPRRMAGRQRARSGRGG